MKRSQKEALAGCAGRCPEAQQLTADLEESAAALDREAEENRALRAEVRRLRAELTRAWAMANCRRGLSA